MGPVPVRRRRPDLGEPDSPVDLTGLWVQPPPTGDVAASVATRRGVDRAPLDPTNPEDRLTLASALWADQTTRLARLRGALEIARDLPAGVDAGDAADWVEVNLTPRAGVASVLSHSLVWEYLAPAGAARIERAITRAGQAASPAAPVGWVRLEPLDALRSHGVLTTVWPGGEPRVLATCGPHGSGVRVP